MPLREGLARDGRATTGRTRSTTCEPARPLRRLQGPRRARCGAEIDAAIARVLDSGWFILGPEVEAFERELAAALGARDAVAVGNGTEALQLALEALGVGPGDEVVTTSLSAAFTALAIVAPGARPVFVDVDPEHAQPRSRGGGRARSRRARGRSCPVHLYGHPADMDPLLELAGERGLAARRGRLPGPRRALPGAAGGHPRRGVRAGRALLLPDQEPRRPRRRRGGPGERPGDARRGCGGSATAARATATGTRSPASTAASTSCRRRSCGWVSATCPRGPNGGGRWPALYLEELDGVRRLALPREQAYARAVHHLFVVRHPRRDALDRGPSGARGRNAHPLPDPAAPAARLRRRWGGRPGDLPVVEAAAGEILSLPLYPELTDEQQGLVVEAVRGRGGGPCDPRALGPATC